MFSLILFLIKSADHPASCQVFSCDPKHFIKCRLHFFIKRDTDEHNTKYDHGKQWNGDNKYQCCFNINGKCHDHCSKYDKRRTEKQTKYKVHTVLYLINITRHSCDQCCRSNGIHLCKRETFNMCKQRMTQLCCKSDCRLCCKILRGNRACQSDHCKQY